MATSRLNVVDLGTEFGLMAEPEGTTEVHVFNGLVKAQLLDETGKQVRTVELNTSEAARIQPAIVDGGPHPGPRRRVCALAVGGVRPARRAVRLRWLQLPGRAAGGAERRLRLGRPVVQCRRPMPGRSRIPTA